MDSGKINAISANLLETPDLDAAVIKALVRDTAVEIINQSADDGWLSVIAPVDGHKRIGWIQSQFVTRESGPSEQVLQCADPLFDFLKPVVIGGDIVVRAATATWFGGPDDASDNGETASGVSTILDPDILGCALPMDGCNNKNTDGSPLPKLPWKTPVRVKNIHTGAELTVPLIDLGPSKTAPSKAGIDLTNAAFRKLGGDLNAGRMTVDYVVVGGAQFLRSAGMGATGLSAGRIGSPAEGQGPPAGAPEWYSLAFKEIGTHETGNNSGAAIARYRALAQCGEDGDPWCAIFANAMFALCRPPTPGTRSASSRSFLDNANFVELGGPALGAVVVFWRESPNSGKGHVGFYHGESSDSIYVLGGNEGDMVQIEPTPKRQLIGYRWPASVGLPAIARIAIAPGAREHQTKLT